MVFEESTFVLTKAPAKATAELTESAVPDPSKKLERPERSTPFVARVHPESDLEQAAPTTATPSPAKETKRSESSQKSQQTPPKGEPRRLQWDTSNVNKARNAQRFPHQASPAGGAGRRVRPDSAKSTSSWNSARDSQPSPSQNSISDSHRSPARTTASPLKHPSPWTLEGGSVLDRNSDDGDSAAENARKESAEEEASKKPTRQELRTQRLEKGWVGNGLTGNLNAEEDCTPRADLKKMSPAHRFGIEGIIRTFTGEGPEGMSGHGKNPNGPPHINCHAGGADEDKASSRSAARAKKQRSGGKWACTGCSVM